MSLFDVINTSSTGMVANRFWLDTIAGNIANANSTRSIDGGPYRRRIPVFEEVVKDALTEMQEEDWEPTKMGKNITKEFHFLFIRF